MGLKVLTEEEARRVEEARGVADDDCISWHKNCNAECCRMFLIRGGARVVDGFMQVHVVLDVDRAWYYKLHGCTYAHGILYVPFNLCTPLEDGSFIVRRTCDYLQDDLKCAGHLTGKPRICRQLTLESIRNDTMPRSAVLTQNCLFKYKLLGEGRT